MTVTDILALGFLAHGFYGTMTLPLPEKLAKGGNIQFLTNISLFFTILFIVLKWTYGLNKLRSYYHTIWNIEASVTVTYWSLVLLYPNSLNNDTLDVSYLLDFEIHLIPYLYLTTIASEVPNVSFKRALLWLIGYIYIYWTAIELFVYVYSSDGITSYPYPFLQGISLIGRARWFFQFVIIGLVNYGVNMYRA